MPKSREQDVLNRRLQPVYTALETPNYKTAQRILDSFSTRDSETQIVRSLRALIHAKTNRISEAIELCDEIAKENPIDRTVLDTMRIVYRTCNADSRTTDIYLAAFEKKPADDLEKKVLVAYLKEKKYKEAAAWAFRAAKKSDSDSMHEVGMCLTMCQFWTGGPPFVVHLAERMMDKYFEEGKMKTEELFLLYLEMSNTTKKRMKLSSDKDSKLINQDWERYKLLGECQIELKEFDEAFETFTLLLEKHNADDWSFASNLIEVSRKKSPSKSFSEIDSIFAKLSEANPKLRNPRLARLEILSSNETTSDKNKLELLMESIVNYFGEYGSKTVCFRDLKKYVSKTSSIPISEWNEKLSKISPEFPVKSDSVSKEDAAKAYQYYVTKLKLLYFISSSSTKDSIFDMDEFAIGNLTSLYMESFDHNKVLNLEKSDRGVGDDVAILILFVLRDWASAKREFPLSWALCVAVDLLEYANSKIEQNFDYWILMVMIYTQLGAISPALEHYSTLRVRGIQYLSGSWLIIDPCLRLGQTNRAIEFCNDAGKFVSDFSHDLPDHLWNALSRGSFSKISEMIRYNDRCNVSHFHLVQSVESALAECSNFHRRKSLSDLGDFFASKSHLEESNVFVRSSLDLESVVPSNDFVIFSPWTSKKIEEEEEDIPEGNKNGNESSLATAVAKSTPHLHLLPFRSSTCTTTKTVSSANVEIPYLSQLRLLDWKFALLQALKILSSPSTPPSQKIWESVFSALSLNPFSNSFDCLRADLVSLAFQICSCVSRIDEIEPSVVAEKMSLLERNVSALSKQFSESIESSSESSSSVSLFEWVLDPLVSISAVASDLLPFALRFSQFVLNSPPKKGKKKAKETWRVYKSICALSTSLFNDSLIGPMLGWISIANERLSTSQTNSHPPPHPLLADSLKKFDSDGNGLRNVFASISKSHAGSLNSVGKTLTEIQAGFIANHNQ